jgi:hypothetical protein
MKMKKQTDRYTPDQLKELAGEYKTTDNPTPDETAEELKEASKHIKRKVEAQNLNLSSGFCFRHYLTFH